MTAMQVPVLHYLMPIEAGGASLRKWQRTHDYDVWIDCRPAEAPPLGVWEMHGNGVIRIPDNDTYMHVVRGGVPHHIEGLFGYWWRSASDIIWVRAARGDKVYYAVVVGGCPGAHQSDAILWICPSCAHVLESHDIKTQGSGLRRFWRREAEIVNAFGANEGARTCGECGRVHPPGYRFGAADENGAGSHNPSVYW